MKNEGIILSFLHSFIPSFLHSLGSIRAAKKKTQQYPVCKEDKIENYDNEYHRKLISGNKT